MDDYTWQKKLNERRRRSRRSATIIFLVIAAAIGAVVWYFFIYLRTPEYALSEARAAFTEHDTARLERYVDMGLLTSRAYDDLTYDLFAYDSTLTPASRVMFEKFYLLVKPELTAGLEQALTSKATTGEFATAGGTDILKGRQLGIDFERFLERSQLRNTTVLETTGIDHGDGTATAHVRVREDYTQTEFTLDVVLTAADDGHYRVSYIANYRDYLGAIAPLQNGDMAAYIDATKSIIADTNYELAMYQQTFEQYAQTTYGTLTPSQREALARLLEDRAIPSLKARQKRLSEVEVPPGAQYLAAQREQSAELGISAWQHLIKGLREDNHSEYETAETLQKQVLAIEMRIGDIIHHTAISQNIPNLP